MGHKSGSGPWVQVKKTAITPPRTVEADGGRIAAQQASYRKFLLFFIIFYKIIVIFIINLTSYVLGGICPSPLPLSTQYSKPGSTLPPTLKRTIWKNSPS
jgi:hypothetical protein